MLSTFRYHMLTTIRYCISANCWNWWHMLSTSLDCASFAIYSSLPHANYNPALHPPQIVEIDGTCYLHHLIVWVLQKTHMDQSVVLSARSWANMDQSLVLSARSWVRAAESVRLSSVLRILHKFASPQIYLRMLSTWLLVFCAYANYFRRSWHLCGLKKKCPGRFFFSRSKKSS